MPATLPADQYFKHDAIAELLLRDPPFYRHSVGGVTLFGGEATLYPDHLKSLLALLKRGQVYIALQAWAGPSRKYRPQS